MLIVSLGSFTCALDLSIVNLSFPTLTTVFDTELSVVIWVNIVYLLISTGLLLFIGRVGDIFGRKKTFLIGFILFTIGLIICSLSPNIFILILARSIQGIGGAIITALGMAIITATFPDTERGKAIGILASVIAAGILAGPVLGGILLETLGWRSIFYLRVPLGLLVLIMGQLFFREEKAATASSKLDLPGVALIFTSLICFLLYFNLFDKFAPASLPSLALIGGAVLLLGLFILREKRTAYPVVDLNLFANWNFAVGNIGLTIMYFSLSAQSVLMPFYLMNGMGYTALETGLLMGAFPLTNILITPLSGWVSDKIGYRLLCATGMALLCLSLFLISGLNLESSIVNILLCFITLGFGMGIFNPPTNSAIMGAAPRDRLGTASAIINSLRQIGASVGTAVSTTIFATRQSFHADRLAVDILDPSLLDRLSLIGGFHDVIIVSMTICGVGLLITLTRGKRELKPPDASL